MPDAAMTIEQWLERVNAPISDADRQLIQIMPDDEAITLIKELAKNGLWDGYGLPSVPGRFPCQRLLKLEYRWDDAYVRFVRKWLYECGILFSTEVRLLSRDYAVRSNWKFIVRYLAYFHVGLDDVLITGRTMQWVLTYHHSETLLFECYRTRPRNGRKNWDFVQRVHEGLVVYREPGE